MGCSGEAEADCNVGQSPIMLEPRDEDRASRLVEILWYYDTTSRGNGKLNEAV